MSRVALLCSEPLRERMAGIGIRYLELARHLAAAGQEVVVVSAGEVGEVPPLPAEVRAFGRGSLAQLLGDCDAAVAQGQLANDLLLECPELPTAIDLYDPWLVENLHYVSTLGLDPYRNDHATWNLQLTRGDLFLCSSRDQWLFYAGFLAAVGRVNPRTSEADPDLERLLRIVPFGLPVELPPHRPVLAARPDSRPRLLLGGLYDWYDPHTLLDALERLEARPWTLVVVRSPNPGTPQRLLAEVEARCRRRGWWQSRVELVDWVPSERRFDLLRDCDLLVAPHRPSLETRLSLRTRFLDAFLAEVPVVVSSGGAVATMVAEHDAGWVCPPADPAALAAAIVAALDEPAERARRVAAARGLAADFGWDQVLAPVVEFCAGPWRDPAKLQFAAPRPTHAPPDSLAFRFRRRLGRVFGAAT